VREAVNRLAPRDVEILHLKYIDGLSHRQLGTRLKITYSAVDSRLNRARARFRNEFTAIDKPLSELTRIGQPFLSVPRSFAKC
jgi:DNA-directed RNA polymerase specialized sigma24 family protein